MAKYSKKSRDMVESAVHRMKKGTLKSGSGQKVKNRKQAIAIGLSEAREKDAKIPLKLATDSSQRKKKPSKSKVR